MSFSDDPAFGMLRRMSTQNLAAVSVFALLVLSGGCAYGELRQVLRAQVASEIDCPDVVVQKSSQFAPGYKENQYTVRGCGVDRIYTCSEDGMVSYGTTKCSYVAGASATKPAATPAPAPSGADDLDAPMGGGAEPEPEPLE